MPEGFKLAPKDRLSDEIKKKTKGVFVQPYSKERPNIFVVGPISGDKHQEIVFPILSPDPATNKDVHFLNYPVYVGGNRGRGQVYPSGEKSNNNAFDSTANGQITSIVPLEKGKTELTIETSDGSSITQIVPKGLKLSVKQGDIIQQGSPLTLNPNVGGVGQSEAAVMLQEPN